MFETKIPIDAVILKRLSGPRHEIIQSVTYSAHIYKQPQYRAESHINMWQARGDIADATIDLIKVIYRWLTRDEMIFHVSIRSVKNEKYSPIDLTNELKKHLLNKGEKTRLEFLEHYEM